MNAVHYFFGQASGRWILRAFTQQSVIAVGFALMAMTHGANMHHWTLTSAPHPLQSRSVMFYLLASLLKDDRKKRL